MTARRETIGFATLCPGDCRDIMPGLPASHCVVTDPPYGIGSRDVEVARRTRSICDPCACLIGRAGVFALALAVVFKKSSSKKISCCCFLSFSCF